jgi:D-sedoheptulose 7-phosphate isomerase
MSDTSAEISQSIDSAISGVIEFRNSCVGEIQALASSIIETFSNGNKLLICGNGGSAADAQHFAAELISSFGRGMERKSLPALALTVDSSVITAISNDFGFDLIFARQVEGIGEIGDMLIAISTSGESKNCLRAVETSKKLGLNTCALTKKGSTLSKSAAISVAVPSTNTQHIQTCHLIAYHTISEIVDNYFYRIQK